MNNYDYANDLKSIEGKSLDDCRRKIKKIYGDDFEIVDHKSIPVPGGFLGFGQRDIVRVEYYVKKRKSQPTPIQTAPVISQNEYKNDFLEASARQIQRQAETEEFLKNRNQILATATATNNNSQQIAKLTEQVEFLSQVISSKDFASNSNDTGLNPSIQRISDMLEANEFTTKYINKIVNRLKSEFTLEELSDFPLVEKTVVDWIGESIQIAELKHHRPPHVIVLVGPTGVGKTTTVAKLTAKLVLNAKSAGEEIPQICMMTVDFMRVGAAEQLSRYGKIITCEFVQAERKEDVQVYFKQNKSRFDYFVIDTSGISPNDYENIGKMHSIIDLEELKADVYLTLDAGSKASDLRNIIKNYEQFGFNSIILTKCDETKTIGNVISVLDELGKSVTFITNGQEVPRFINKANVVQALTSLVEFNIDRDHIERKFGPEE